GAPYSIVVSAMGYAEQGQSGFALNLGDELTIDFEMKVTTTEIAHVEILANSLKSTVKSLGSSTPITSQEIAKMPVNGRNFTLLLQLTPLRNGSSLGGQLSFSANLSINGMTAKGTIAGGSTSGSYSISMEAVREFKVVTNEYDVTNGRAGGGTISTVTKSRTNKLSGSAFAFGRTEIGRASCRELEEVAQVA